MKEIPVLFIFFGLLYGVLFVIRNIYYFKLWYYRDHFDNDEQRSKVFSLGIQKFMFPILLDEKIADPTINEIIKKVNLYNYLQFLSFFLASISFFYPNLFI